MKTKMNTKTLLTTLIVALAVFAFNFTSAFVAGDEAVVDFNGIGINHPGAHADILMSGITGETVPVRVSFVADADASDVKIKVEIYGGNEEYSDSTSRFNVVSGVAYTKLLNLQLPKTLDETNENLSLKVRIYNQDYESSESYTLSIQRDSYKLGLLSVDYDTTVSAGDVVPVSVVVKNRGFENSQDGFVTVSIQELGIYAKGYFGDLVAIEDCSSDCDNEDAAQKVLNIKIPTDAKEGVYDLVVKVYDEETTTTVVQSIKVSASTESQMISTTNSQDLKAGQTKTYELILVNSADKVMVYQLSAVSGSALSVSVPSVVTVDAGSSKVVQVTVTASKDAEKGAYPFTVAANGQTVVFNANVTESSYSVSAIVLTIVLVVIFVALLVVLLVLLLRKEKPAEEVETSYY